MNELKEYNIGDTVTYNWNDFDGNGKMVGIVVSKFNDHIIIESDGMKLWLDNDNKSMFKINKCEPYNIQ